MSDWYFYLYIIALSISTCMLGIGLFSLVFLVIPYVWFLRIKDRRLWLSIGQPWLGLSMGEINNVIGFLWVKGYEESENNGLIIYSRVLRVVYVKCIFIGVFMFVFLFIIRNCFPEIEVWIDTYLKNKS